MLNITQTSYYKRLDKLLLWPLVAYISLIPVFFIFQIYLFYSKYLSEIIALLMEQSLSPEMITFVESGIHKIIINLSVWIFVLFVMNIMLVYVIWNVRKLLVEVRKRGC